MVGHHAKPAARVEHLHGLRQHLPQSLELAVHLYAQCLEYHCQRLVLAASGQVLLHGLLKVVGRQNTRTLRSPFSVLRSPFHNALRYLLGIGQLAVKLHNALQLVHVSGVDQVGSRRTLAAVHTQIERTVHPCREASLGLVDLVARHAEVGQQAVNVAHAVEPQKVLEVCKVLVYQAETRVVDTIAGCVAVAVESVEASALTKARQDGARVTAAAEGDVDIYPVGAYVEPIQALGQHHRPVVTVCIIRCQHW